MVLQNESCMSMMSVIFFATFYNFLMCIFSVREICLTCILIQTIKSILSKK